MVITSELVRAGRALLRWEQKDLAEASGVSLASIKRLETQAGPLAAQPRTIDAICAALNNAGVEFTNGGQPGVRLKKVTARCAKCGFEASVEDQETNLAQNANLCKNGGKPAACSDLRKAVSAAHQALRAVSPGRTAKPFR